MLAPIAEVFGNRRGGICGTDSQQRRFIAGGDDDNTARQPVGSEVAFHEVVDFAATLADECRDDDVGVVPRLIIPRSTLLPTPEPEKIPSRCPRPQVNKASMACTPVASGWRMRGRFAGDGADRSCRARSANNGCGRPSIA